MRFTEINLFGVSRAGLGADGRRLDGHDRAAPVRHPPPGRMGVPTVCCGCLQPRGRRLGVYRGSAPLLEVERVEDDFKLMQRSLAARPLAAMSWAKFTP
jgi:hypothetical protein